MQPVTTEELAARIKEILKLCAAEIRPCRLCEEKLYFMPVPLIGKNKTIPYNEDGRLHAPICKRRPPKQQQLIDLTPNQEYPA